MPVSLAELIDALEFASFEGILGEHQAILCKPTGQIYMHIEFAGEEEDELPDDIEDDEKYIAIPHKRDLGLGKPLVLDFARKCLPDDFDEVDTSSASGGRTRNSEICWREETRLTAGMISRRRRPSARYANGASCTTSLWLTDASPSARCDRRAKKVQLARHTE